MDGNAYGTPEHLSLRRFLTFTGWIVGADPADYVLDRCAAFAGESHLAVCCRCARRTGSRAQRCRVYVDAPPGGRTELTWCASAAADMTVTGVGLRFDRVLVSPLAPGAYRWRAGFDNADRDVRSALGALTTSATAVVRVRAPG